MKIPRKANNPVCVAEWSQTGRVTRIMSPPPHAVAP